MFVGPVKVQSCFHKKQVMHKHICKVAFELFTVVSEVKKNYTLSEIDYYSHFFFFFNIMKPASKFHNSEIFKNFLITLGLHTMDFQILLLVKLNTKTSHKPPQ